MSRAPQVDNPTFDQKIMLQAKRPYALGQRDAGGDGNARGIGDVYGTVLP